MLKEQIKSNMFKKVKKKKLLIAKKKKIMENKERRNIRNISIKNIKIKEMIENQRKKMYQITQLLWNSIKRTIQLLLLKQMRKMLKLQNKTY